MLLRNLVKFSPHFHKSNGFRNFTPVFTTYDFFLWIFKKINTFEEQKKKNSLFMFILDMWTWKQNKWKMKRIFSYFAHLNTFCKDEIEITDNWNMFVKKTFYFFQTRKSGILVSVIIGDNGINFKWKQKILPIIISFSYFYVPLFHFFQQVDLNHTQIAGHSHCCFLLTEIRYWPQHCKSHPTYYQ